MYIQDSLVDLILKRVKIEYSGLHSSNGWSARAYFRLYTQDDTFLAKVVTGPIKSKNPKQKTLDKALKTELKKRFQSIQIVVDTDHYGQVSKPRIVDPYSVMKLVDLIQSKYYDLMIQGRQ